MFELVIYLSANQNPVFKSFWKIWVVSGFLTLHCLMPELVINIQGSKHFKTGYKQEPLVVM